MDFLLCNRFDLRSFKLNWKQFYMQDDEFCDSTCPRRIIISLGLNLFEDIL